MPISSEPEPAMVRWNPFAMARKASSTMTTRATATTVDSDSSIRRGMLLRLMVVTAAIWSRRERIGSSSPQRGRDLQPHGVERRDDAGDEPEREHQNDGFRRDLARERKAGQQVGDAGAQPDRREHGKRKPRKSAEEGEQDRLAKHEAQNSA